MEEKGGPVGESIRWARPRGGITGLFFILAFMPMTSAESQEFHTLTTSSANITESKVEGTTTDLESFNQTVDYNWNRSVSPFLRYRITLRGQDSRNRTKVNSNLTRTSSMLLEPIFDVTLATPAYSLNTGLRLRELITDGNRVERVRLSDRRVFTRFFLTPERLPSLSLQVDRRMSEDNRDPRVRDTEDTRYEVSTQYEFEGASFSYTYFDRINEDNVANRTRDRQSHVGTMGYAQTFFDERLAVHGDYTVDYTPTREEFSSAAVVEVERRLRRGLRAAPDSSPTDSSDVPLTDDPGLVAGTASVPLILNASIGFELVSRESVAEIQVSLAPEPPFSLPDLLQQFLNFRVFLTDDTTLATWSEVAGVSQSFDPLEGRFILTFSAATARSFKVFVSRNDFGTLVRATGIKALDSEGVAVGSERRSSSLLHNVGAGFTVRPIKAATVSYNFSLTDLTQKPRSVQTTSGVHTGSLKVEPHRLLTTTLSYQHSFDNFNEAGVEDTTADNYSLTLNSNPLPTLTSSLSLVRNESRSEGKLERRVHTASTSNSAEIYRNLKVDSTFSLSKSEDFTTDQDSISQTGRLNATATLTSSLSAILGYTFQRTRTEGPDQQTTTTSHTGSAAFTYTLSRLLNFNTRFDFFHSTDTTNFTQTYKLDWIPTSKVSSFIDYQRIEQRSNSDTTGSDSITVNSRWNISRYLSLDANFLFFQSFAGDTVQSFSASAQFRF